MAYRIDGASCISCGACVAECPVDAIHQKDNAYVIDAAVCTSCGSCVDVCPVDCISPEMEEQQ